MNELFEDYLSTSRLDPFLNERLQYGERRRYLLKREKTWELILILWGPGSQTKIHGHNESKCWTQIVKGALTEKVYQGEMPELISEHILVSGENHFIEDSIGSHQIINKSDEIVVSLHLYADPIEKCSVYDEDSGIWKIEAVGFDGILENEDDK